MILKSCSLAKSGGLFLDEPVYFADIDHQPLKIPIARCGPNQWEIPESSLDDVKFVHVFVEVSPVGRRWMFASIEDIHASCNDGVVEIEQALARTLVARCQEKFSLSNTDFSGEPAKVFKQALSLIKESSPQAVGLASWALEEECLIRARRTAQTNPHKKLRFGSFAFMSRLEESREYNELYCKLFNAGTAPFYRSIIEPREGNYDWQLTDKIVDWLNSKGKHVKGHPLLWFHRAAMPEWLCRKNFASILQNTKEHVTRTIKRFKDRIKMWDVINEAHGWANHLQFSEGAMIELIRVACVSAREVDPDAKLVVNCCLPFAEYAVKDKSTNKLNTPYRYLKALNEAHIDYDIIGLQFYCNQIDRSFADVAELLDRFSIFNKPIAISETGCPSRGDISPNNSQIYHYGPALNYAEPFDISVRSSWEKWYDKCGFWRRRWDENSQADWLEFLWVLAKSHPNVKELTYLDLTDHFLCSIIPYGGLVDSEMNPKLAYKRLLSLQGK